MSGSVNKNRASFAQRKEQIVFSNPDDRRDSRSKQHSDCHPDDNWKLCIFYELKGWWKISFKTKAQAEKLFLYSIEKTSKRGHGIDYIVLQERTACGSWCDMKTYTSGDRSPK